MSDPHQPARPAPIYPPEWIHPEDQAARHQKIIEDNEARTRANRAAANRAANLPAPVVGSKLFVTCVRGIPRRGRAGLRFDPVARREVEVVDLSPAELAVAQAQGHSVVDVDGAERILEDSSLIVYKTTGPGEDSNDAAHLRAENADLKAQLAAARRNAPPDPGDGSSARLKAAQKTRDGGDFGSSK
jgi:hypothetical protein